MQQLHSWSFSPSLFLSFHLLCLYCDNNITKDVASSFPSRRLCLYVFLPTILSVSVSMCLCVSQSLLYAFTHITKDVASSFLSRRLCLSVFLCHSSLSPPSTPPFSLTVSAFLCVCMYVFQCAHLSLSPPPHTHTHSPPPHSQRNLSCRLAAA